MNLLLSSTTARRQTAHIGRQTLFVVDPLEFNVSDAGSRLYDGAIDSVARTIAMFESATSPTTSLDNAASPHTLRRSVLEPFCSVKRFSPTNAGLLQALPVPLSLSLHPSPSPSSSPSFSSPLSLPSPILHPSLPSSFLLPPFSFLLSSSSSSPHPLLPLLPPSPSSPSSPSPLLLPPPSWVSGRRNKHVFCLGSRWRPFFGDSHC